MTRSIRNQPFCWQEKHILRLLRKIFKGQELAKLRTLYGTITEIDSDFNGKVIKWYTKTIATYSGLSKEWIPTGLKKLEQLKIISISNSRDKEGKFESKTITFTPNLTVSGKPLNGDSDTLEHNFLLEDIPSKKSDNSENTNEGDDCHPPPDKIPKEITSLTVYFANLIINKVCPPTFRNRPPKIETWVKDIDKLHRIDGASLEDIKRVMEWTVQSWWGKVILSGENLRKHYNRLYLDMMADNRQKKQPTIDDIYPMNTNR